MDNLENSTATPSGKLIILMILAGLTGLLSNLTFLLAHADHNDRNQYAYNPSLFTWISFTALLTGIACSLIPLVLFSIKQLIQTFGFRPKSFLYILSAMAALFSLIMWLTYGKGPVPYVLNPIPLIESLLPVNPWSLAFFIVPVLLTAFLDLFGQLIVNQAIDRIETTEHFLLLYRKLNFFLVANAAVVVGTVLVTDSFKLAIDGETAMKPALIPQSVIFLYGLMFSFYVGLIYLPVYFRLKSRGRELARIHSNSSDAAQFLLEPPPLELLKILLSILGPMIGALLPGILLK